MNIKSGLVMGTSGEEVAALHDALSVIGLQIEVSERDTQSFGASTIAAVIKLQALAGIEQTGAVDDNTIAVVSLALDRLGISVSGEGFKAAAAPYVVGGKVTDGDGLPIDKAHVVAYDCDLRDRKVIGRGRTDAGGGYRIAYKHEDLLHGRKAADLRVELQKSRGELLFSSPILFNAPRQATIDLALGGPQHSQPSEFSALLATVTPLLGRIEPAELQEDSEHHDVSFISSQTAIPAERIGFWVIATRLATQTEVPAPMFYGLFRGGVPVNAGVTALAGSSQGIDFETNASALLEGVLSTPQATVVKVLDAAIAANTIPASLAGEVAGAATKLNALAGKAALSSKQGFGKTSIADVLGAVKVPAEVQEKFIAIAKEPSSSPEGFWSDLEKDQSFTATEVAELHFGVLAGQLTRGYVPLMEELGSQLSSGQVKDASDLARLTEAQWNALLEKPGANGKPIGVPEFIEAQTPKLAQEAYAAMLERNFTRTYPTSAFSARVAADEQSPFQAASATAQFLDANPTFDLRKSNIDVFAAKSKLAPEVRATLLSAQRLIKVNSDYAVMSALMNDGVQTAQQMYFMGPERFLSKYSTVAGVGAAEIARTWQMAEQTYGMALATSMKYNAMLGASNPIAVGRELPQEVNDQVAGFPNLQTLFGPESLCECSECQSVLGAAAYLTDILDFLQQRDANAASSVREVLLQRRPDIAQIELNCPNTNTELPYIDLVNELLEEAVAPAKGSAEATARQRQRQTTLSTPELNANPQYVNEAAYTTLASAVYPWTLPFSLPLAESRAYLGQLGLSRTELISTFQAPAGYPSPQAEALAIEQLNLSALEADIIVAGPLATAFAPWQYWGLAERKNTLVDPDDPTKKVSGEWIEVLAQVRVLLARGALSYQELLQLLNTIFVNGGEAVKIVNDPPGSCDVATMELRGLTTDVLERIHRFVRLWRCLGWSPYELDNAISSLQSATAAGLGQLNAQLLRQLAAVSVASKRYGLSIPSAVALFAPTPESITIATRAIPTLPGAEQQYSLYHELFENLTVLNPPDPIFALNASGTEIADASPAPMLGEHGAALIAAFAISQSEVTLAIEAFASNGKLTLSNLSALYRNIQLAHMLEVTIPELVSLLAIAETASSAPTGYEVVEPFDATRPEALSTFAEIYARLTAGGLSIEQVDYIVRGSDLGGAVAPEPVAVGTLLLGLYNGLSKIKSENAYAADPTGARTRKALATLLEAAEANAVFAILSGASTASSAEQQSSIALLSAKLGSYIDPVKAEEALLGSSALEAGAARFDYVLASLLEFQVGTLSTGLVIQTLSQALGLQAATAQLLLVKWFPSVTPGEFAIADFLALPNKKLAQPTTPISPTEAEFESYFATYAALSRAALLISSLKLSSEDVAWWMNEGIKDGWLDPTKPPTAAVEGRFQSLSRLISAAKVREEVPVAGATFASLFGPPASGAAKSEYITQLAELTQWPLATLEELCGPLATAGATGELSLSYPQDYRCEIALSRLLPCEKILAQSGIPANVAGWIVQRPQGAETPAEFAAAAAGAAAEIKQSVKANNPGEQWLTLAKELRDPLRQQQRDALVAYLLAGQPPAGAASWLNPEDVFAHFLIDVEMCSCMATSRIVQASATVQLFVQRCFLALEPNVTVDVSSDSTWLQWQWMSQFRVWQANREVFLFPENWINPTLRADASPFFTELQQDLKHGSLNAEVAETALHNYLEKLESVARLDVCGLFYDNEEDGKEVTHVLARTQSSPPVYYMRKWLNSAIWSAWEKIELDIVSEHVIPIMWRGRRYIFWAVATVKADQHGQPIPPAETSKKTPNGPKLHLEVQLAWSQFKQGKWQPKQTAPQTLVFAPPWEGKEGYIPPPFKLQGFDSSDVTLKTSFNGSKLQIDVFLDSAKREGIEYLITNFSRAHVGMFMLGGAGSGVEAFLTPQYREALENVGGSVPVSEVGTLEGAMVKPEIEAPFAMTFDGEWLVPEEASFLEALRPRTSDVFVTYLYYKELSTQLLLECADYCRLVTPHQTPALDSTLPFFYRDPARQYFIVPVYFYQYGNEFSLEAPRSQYETPYYVAAYEFWNFYHPFANLFTSRLNIGGIEALYAPELQLDPNAVAGNKTPFNFAKYYEPSGWVMTEYPEEAVDFAPDDGYALYNWELFYHAPFMIANALSTNQEFELAKQWYEYVFNPTSGKDEPVPQRYWITKPFHEMNEKQYAEEQLAKLMQEINKHNRTLENEVALWRAEPFDPDAIAQMRPVAYQRAIVMQYIDNLIAWGDYLFTQDTRETINQATQLYILAGDLLGPKPEVVPPLVQPEVKTYAELEGSLDAFSNALVAAENAIPPVKVNVPTPSGAASMPQLKTLYFQIPPNSQLLGYWDTVADRLYKIRHCMNIEGVVQDLALFAPPINPGLLVAAAAAGLDLTSVLANTNAALPPYRFRTMIRHALELCDQVRNLGGQLLAALEKSDAERLAQIRSGAELNLQSAIDEVRARQIKGAEQQLEVLAKTKQSWVDRETYYANRSLMNEWEGVAMTLHAAALIPQTVATVLDGTATVAHALPSVEAGASGFGGSPTVTLKIGGENVGKAANSGAWIARMIAGIMQTSAEISATLGQYHQRHDEWTLQGTVAKDEVARVEAERVGAEIHIDVATKEKLAQDISVGEAREVDAFLHSKFTNKELYDWMVSQTSTTYFQAYQLAYSVAKAAEQCFARELGIGESDYIQFGYWEGLHQGLTAGDKLQYDLRRMESAYFTQNDRELELVKHVSLLQLDPYALVQLRETGSCQIELPETLFDLENPGHYMRRIKTVGLTVPCVVGPYTSVSATLTLLNNQIRTSADSEEYARKPGIDERFLDDPGGAEIVSSSAQNDSGLFELRFEDERYLPFESAGAVSNWRLTLNNVFAQFDYTTITDVVLHVRYTARDGGAPLRSAAAEAVKTSLNKLAMAQAGREGLYRMFSARHEFPTNWAQFLNPAAGADQMLTLEMGPERFPFFTHGLDLKAHSLDVLARMSDESTCTLSLTLPGSTTAQEHQMKPDSSLAGMNHYEIGPLSPTVDLGRAPLPSGDAPTAWKLMLKQEGTKDFKSLEAADIEDILLIVGYQVEA